MPKALLASTATAALSRPPDLPAEGFVRLDQIVGPGKPIPVSKSSWWRGVKDGVYPAPVKLGPNTTVWRVADIRKLLSIGEAA